jgi:hypothetical protein
MSVIGWRHTGSHHRRCVIVTGHLVGGCVPRGLGVLPAEVLSSIIGQSLVFEENQVEGAHLVETPITQMGDAPWSFPVQIAE